MEDLIRSLTDEFSSMKDIINQVVKGISETKNQQQLNNSTQSLFSSGMIKEIEP
ncbi:MAG: hypothetical protein ACTHKK_08400 [Candidatus Nitrosocosmicus sp.]